MAQKTEIVVFGGGCFWCTEAIFKMLRGVISVTPGYAGGAMKNPSYYDVTGGDTGHAEVIRIEFDPTVIPYHDLLDIFWHTHDPTSLNRQGADVGTQYRSAVFYTTPEQKETTQKSLEELKKSGNFKNGIVTDVKPLGTFYEAEDYHKNYYEKNSFEPYCRIVIDPKLKHLREKYSDKLKNAI